MRYRICVLLIVLHAVARIGCATENSSRVSVEPAMTKVVPNMPLLRNACLVEGEFDACTNFIAFRMTPACIGEGEAWHIQATATFRPWIILYNIRQLPHEKEHVEDVRTFAERYLVEVSVASYASQEQCMQAALNESASFGVTMRELARRSNALRHPQVYAKIR